MDIWSWIFAENFRIIFKVCIDTNRGKVWTGVDSQKSLKMCGHPLWIAPYKIVNGKALKI